VDLDSLGYVVTLAEELHFGRAAQRHYIVPQAFGRHVRFLRQGTAGPGNQGLALEHVEMDWDSQYDAVRSGIRGDWLP
jgi:hypothetical protein